MSAFLVAILALAAFMPQGEGIRFAGSCAGGRMATEHSLQNDLQGLLEIGSICLPPGPIDLKKPIVIDESVNIEGAFPFTTLQCPPGGSAFIIKAADVNMTRLNFTGCENGPAVVVEGDADTAPCKGSDGKACVSPCLIGNIVRVNGSVFEGCTGTKGGAISVINGTLVVSDSEFSNNSADEGGAIYGENSCVLVNYSSFTTNSAETNGGAVELVNSVTRMFNSHFITNSAMREGGAIGASLSSLLLGVLAFAENFAVERGGGAVSLYQSEAELTTVDFVVNSAEMGVGGGLFSNSSTIVAEDVAFAGNTALTEGGAAAIAGGVVSLTTVGMYDNYANDGGALIIYTSDETVITDGTFDSNSADRNGGALAAFKSSISVIDSEFLENEAGTTGGALWLNVTDATLTDVSFVNNTAPEGAAMQVLKSNVTTTNVNISANAANALGGMFELTLADATLKDPEAATIATASSGQRTLLPTK